jgi:hypothetical protein
VFEILTIADVVTSELYNGSYLKMAEKVKKACILTLLAHAQNRQIKVQLSVSLLSLNSSPVHEEIASLQPHSMSWSNILDYMSPDQFHALAKNCSSTAVHSGELHEVARFHICLLSLLPFKRAMGAGINHLVALCHGCWHISLLIFEIVLLDGDFDHDFS